MASINSQKQIEKSRLGRLLVNRGYITEKQLEAALIQQREQGVMLGEVLVASGLISQKDLDRTLKHQKRYRYAAAFVAMAVTPLQPAIALASGSASAGLNENQNAYSQLADFTKKSGLKPLADSEMDGVSAKGFMEDFEWLNNAVADAQNGESPSTDPIESTEDTDQIGQVKFLAHLAVPLTNFIEADTTVEGVRYESSGSLMTVNGDGSMDLAFPSHIDRISMRNVNFKGSTAPPIGDLYFSDISMNVSMTITPR